MTVSFRLIFPLGFKIPLALLLLPLPLALALVPVWGRGLCGEGDGDAVASDAKGWAGAGAVRWLWGGRTAPALDELPLMTSSFKILALLEFLLEDLVALI